MDDTDEKGGTMLRPRNSIFEERAAAYEVEGGNLEKSVVLAQRGLTVGCNRLLTGDRTAAF